MPKVSVIIPCYNQGIYLDEAVESVLAQSFVDYEIIVVDDGSEDQTTVTLLDSYKRPKTRLIRTPNQGLAEARNNGIREARGKYILPLDADDWIGPDYLALAVTILDEKPDVGIVYCFSETFGAHAGSWFAPEYSLHRMLIGNLIFCSALFRRTDWELVGGYRPNMGIGWEDWDFWLSLIELDREVCRIPKVLFYYRVQDGSMAASMDAASKAEMHRQVMRNHRELFVENSLPMLTLYYRVTESRLYRFLKMLKLPYLVGQLMAAGKRSQK